MIKNWCKIGETKYAFSVNGIEIGMLDININAVDSNAVAKIGDDEFIIRRTDFWKSNIEITKNAKTVIAHTSVEKWYASTLTLNYNEKKYKLVLRNNPLAEYAILDADTIILAYGLNTMNNNGKIGVKVTGTVNSQDYLLDFLLWYLFVPIAMENIVDMNTILILSMASS